MTAVESQAQTAQAGDELLVAHRLTKHFTVGSASLASRRQTIHAVDDVSFALRAGRVTALVGESGSGKSTVARLLARLYTPTVGEIVFHGRPVSGRRSRRALLPYRAEVQMIFQDPFGSLNPAKTIEHHIARPLRIHGVVPGERVRERVDELLHTVGLVPPREIARKYPHELSGGQRQRVAIARALAVQPAVLLADEPISMLDVSIRIGILNLMRRLKEEYGIALLYVTHDLASARYLADEILVMYAGQIVEQGETETVLGNPLHPYTRLLLAAAPDPGLQASERVAATRRTVESPPRLRCRFADRCPVAVERSLHAVPSLIEAEPGHLVRCHLYEPVR